jgi:hypothetical protein
MNTSVYLGIRFYVWNAQHGWFWLIVNGRRDGGIVGAAAGEGDAIREARLSIEQMASAAELAESHTDSS